MSGGKVAGRLRRFLPDEAALAAWVEALPPPGSLDRPARDRVEAGIRSYYRAIGSPQPVIVWTQSPAAYVARQGQRARRIAVAADLPARRDLRRRRAAAVLAGLASVVLWVAGWWGCLEVASLLMSDRLTDPLKRWAEPWSTVALLVVTVAVMAVFVVALFGLPMALVAALSPFTDLSDPLPGRRRLGPRRRRDWCAEPAAAVLSAWRAKTRPDPRDLERWLEWSRRRVVATGRPRYDASGCVDWRDADHQWISPRYDAAAAVTVGLSDDAGGRHATVRAGFFDLRQAVDAGLLQPDATLRAVLASIEQTWDAFCWVALWRVAVVLEPPLELVVRDGDDRGRLHCDDGPAVRWPDGTEQYALDGVVVERALWAGEWTAAQVHLEPNSEVRRRAIERMGWTTYLDRAALTPFATAPDPGNPGAELALYDIPDARSARLLVMRNGSPDRSGAVLQYAELVPRDLDDPVAAAAWQYGCGVEEYRALQRRT